MAYNLKSRKPQIFESECEDDDDGKKYLFIRVCYLLRTLLFVHTMYLSNCTYSKVTLI